MGLSSKKNRRRKRVRISNKGNSTNVSNVSFAAPNLTPQQISLIAALLAGLFNIDSVIYTRDNFLQVLLSTDQLTELPILGPSSKKQQTDILNSVDITESDQIQGIL